MKAKPAVAVTTLRAAVEKDPESLDPYDMIEYLRGAMRAALTLLGVAVEEPDFDEVEYPTHGEQVAAARDDIRPW